MNQAEFTGVFCARPQNYAWFLGAGASRSAGLPTASDILWDLKKKYYCREENQELARQDIQNAAIRERIQSFMDSRGFPSAGSPEEYPAYFERLFGADKERQRRYLSAVLSEDKVTLAVGSRVLGAMLASGFCRAAFTTNFDSVVERAVADVAGLSISAFHLEGSHNAINALNNEEYPLYCKLHGDFRYDSLKNLPADLAAQNEMLSACLVNAANRFGFVVAGYSGRDESIMNLFRSVLASHNPFPHGLFWTGLKGSAEAPPVTSLLQEARGRGITAEYVPIETFDALILRLWRNIVGKSAEIDAKVRKSAMVAVTIPLPPAGRQKPVLRLNALPVASLPAKCLSLHFRIAKTSDEIRRTRDSTKARIILSGTQNGLCWGTEDVITKTYGDDLLGIEQVDLPADILHPANLHLKGFLEEALCWALARGKPLVSRNTRRGSFLIANPAATTKTLLAPLARTATTVGGEILGLMTAPTPRLPKGEQVRWAEALRISLEMKDGRHWLLIQPDIWVWPEHARRDATVFLDNRRGDRYNSKHDALLSAWIQIMAGTDELNTEVTLQPFDGDIDAGNPSFTVGTRTAFSKKNA